MRINRRQMLTVSRDLANQPNVALLSSDFNLIVSVE